MAEPLHELQTSDIGAAAHIRASGGRLLRIDATDPERAVFIFASPRPDLIEDFNKGGTTSSLAFVQSLRWLRGAVTRAQAKAGESR